MTLLLLFLLTFAACSAGADAVEVWAAPSVYKVRPEERTQTSNLVWDARTKTISIAGARNEHVPFQVVVSAPKPPNEYHPAASGFFVEASDLVSPQGRIPRDRVKLYVEHAVLCYGKSSPIGETGFWPDALAPLTDPFSMAAEFRHSVKSRAVWIDVVTPAEIPAGEYEGTIRVTQSGRAIDELKLRLKVYGFALPEETHLITYMGVSSRQLASFHSLKASSPEARALLRKYHEFLYANRMEPWFNESLQPEIELGADGVQVKFDDQAYDLYMNRWRTKRVILEAAPSELVHKSKFPPFSQ